MPAAEQKPKKRRKKSKRTVLALHLAWLAVLLFIAPALSQTFMPAAVLTLGPPVFYLPASLLFVFISLWQGGRWLAAHAVAALLAAWPLFGWMPPLRLGAKPKPFVKVATFNVAGDEADLRRLAEWIEAEEIDVICLQEVNGTENIGQQLLTRLDGWHGAIRREVAILSRFPLGREQSIPMGGRLNRDVLAVEVGAPRPLWVASVHWPAPQPTKGLSRLAEDQQVRSEYLASTLEIGSRRDWPTVLGGDFNTPPRHGLYREMLAQYGNAFAQSGKGLGYTFSKDRSMIRIDHLWLSSDLKAADCQVGPDLGSDHLPVVAEIGLLDGK